MNVADYLPAESSKKPAESWQLNLLRDIKEERFDLDIPILNYDGFEVGELKPITRRHVDDKSLAEAFVKWRNQNRHGWLDQRPVTLEGTQSWVNHVVEAPNRINFLIYTKTKMIGRCGILNLHALWHESDGLVRGESGGGIHLIHQAQFAANRWMIDTLKQQYFVSKILSSNELALSNAITLGYSSINIVKRPIYLQAHESGMEFVEDSLDSTPVQGASLNYLIMNSAEFEVCYQSRFIPQSQRNGAER